MCIETFVAQFGGSEAIITALSDEFKWIKKHREIFVGILFAFYFLIGLASCTQVGSEPPCSFFSLG